MKTINALKTELWKWEVKRMEAEKSYQELWPSATMVELKEPEAFLPTPELLAEAERRHAKVKEADDRIQEIFKELRDLQT